MTAYIAYVERITDAYSQQDIVVLMMESILNTHSVNVKSAICSCQLLHGRTFSILRMSAESTAW